MKKRTEFFNTLTKQDQIDFEIFYYEYRTDIFKSFEEYLNEDFESLSDFNTKGFILESKAPKEEFKHIDYRDN